MKLKDLTIFRGKKAKIGPVHTMNIKLNDLRVVFFPKGFHEKYQYLGAIPWNEDGKLFQAMEPLIIFMDYKARPKWCPRWFLRFLHLFGNDNSIVRVRNFKLHNFSRKLTKGIFMYDYKTKWEWYDLRISVTGNDQIQNLADMIEYDFYKRGQREDLIEELKRYVPNPERTYWGSNESLREELEKFQEAEEAAKAAAEAPKKRGRKKKTEE
jgi:hypothetical protein